MCRDYARAGVDGARGRGEVEERVGEGVLGVGGLVRVRMGVLGSGVCG